MKHDNYTETHEFLVSILAGVPFGIITIDLRGDITMCNEQAVNLLDLGQAPRQLLEASIFDFVTPLPELHDALQQCYTTGRQPFTFAGIPWQDKFLNISGKRLLSGMMLTLEDVSFVKKHEIENLNAVLQGQEGERRRLAREMHDGVGPLLSTLKLQLDGLKSALPDPSSNVASKIAAMEQLIQEVATDIRNVSHALMPSALIDLGLVAALENLCRKIQATNQVTINFYPTGMNERLDPPLALGLFRITQELLNNVLKHAEAQTITVQLIKHPNSILLMVEDDGAGFDPQQLEANKGIGLRNVETRTTALGGRLLLETQPQQGVQITIEIPL